MKASHLKYATLAALAVLVAFAFFGHPLIDPASAMSLGALPFVVGETKSVNQICEMIQEQGKEWREFKTAQSMRLESLEREQRELSKKANRPQLEAGGTVFTSDGGEHKDAFDRYLRRGDDSGLAEIQRKAMNTGSDPDGGYLVLPEMDATIDRVAQTMGGLATLANVVNVGTAKWEKMVKTSGMAMRRVADGGTGGETTEPRYTKVTIEVFPAEIEPWVYNETLEDSFVNLEKDLADEAAVGFAEGANAEYISGNGVGKARGIASYPMVANSAFAWGSVGYIASGKSAAFTSVAPGDALVSLQHALKSQYRPGAVWLMNDTTLGVVRQMKDGSGSYYLWQPDPLEAFGGRLLGSPVVVDDNMPDIAAGAYSVAYGNFKHAYTIVNRKGITLIRDNITAKGVTKFNLRKRFGAGITNFEAVKMLRFATS